MSTYEPAGNVSEWSDVLPFTVGEAAASGVQIALGEGSRGQLGEVEVAIADTLLYLRPTLLARDAERRNS